MTAPSATFLSAETLLERIALLTDAPAAPDAEDLQRLLAHAAVQACFTRTRLFADAEVRPTASLRNGLREVSRQMDAAGKHDERTQWQLDLDARQQALRQLASLDAIRQTRARVHPARIDASQRMFDALLTGGAPALEELGHDELAALLIVGEWLEGSVVPLPPTERVRAQLARERLVHPMRRLIGDHFVGRKDELSRLADYVGVLPPDAILRSSSLGAGRRFARQVWHTLRERPPLYIAGPGGVGKSSLVARFILDHMRADESEHLPFVFLDFDRAQVDPAEPYTLLVAALHQLRVQFPRHDDEMQRMAQQIGWRVAKRDAAEGSKLEALQDDLVKAFATTLESLFGGASSPTPLLWVLDTFEEPQRRGESTVGALWNLMNTLQQQLPRLRLVVSGRVVPRGFSWETVELSEFDDESAAAYLRGRLKTVAPDLAAPDRLLQDVIGAVGRTPLALRMAARVIANEGTKSLSSLTLRRLIIFSMRSDQIQAVLFHRVLEHIRVYDPGLEADERRRIEGDLRKLAYPGLAVRRLTPEVIHEVLAAPCGLKLHSAAEAQQLYEAMRSQVDVVEPDDEGGALVHIPTVRQLMLRDLEEKAGSKLRLIDRRAVRHYARRDTVRDRAEEIYHRLRLDEPVGKIEARWQPGIERYLLSALDDVGDSLRVYLAEKLGVTLPAAALAKAEQSDWERQSQRRMQEYLAAGDPHSVLAVLKERSQRSKNSPLLRLEAEAWHLLNDSAKAARVAARALDEAVAAGAQAQAIDLTLLLSVIEEGRGDLAAAGRHAAQAEDWAWRSGSMLEVVRARVSKLRLARKTLRPDAAELHEGRIEALKLLDTELQRELRSRPALQRELVAELGAHDPRVLRRGVQALGVDLADNTAVRNFARLLAAWGGRDAEAKAAVADVAAAHAVVTDARKPPAARDWLAWLLRSSARDIGALTAALLRRVPPREETLAAIAAIYQRDSEQRISKSNRRRLV
jgi:hypothetical protein